MNILNRYKKTTPKFFRILRNIGIALATSGGAILASPFGIPASTASIIAYITIAGAVASAVSQAAVEDQNLNCNSKVEDHDLL